MRVIVRAVIFERSELPFVDRPRHTPRFGLTPLPRIPIRGSIAGRRASGFHKVSLSKVPRRQHGGASHQLARHFR
jgi:hypothetical protein